MDRKYREKHPEESTGITQFHYTVETALFELWGIISASGCNEMDMRILKSRARKIMNRAGLLEDDYADTFK